MLRRLFFAAHGGTLLVSVFCVGPTFGQTPIGLERASLTPTMEDCNALSARLKNQVEQFRDPYTACSLRVPVNTRQDYRTLEACGRSLYSARMCRAEAQALLCATSHWLSEASTCRQRAQALESVRRTAENELRSEAEKAADATAPGTMPLYESYQDFRDRLKRGELIVHDIYTLGDRDADWRNRTGAAVSLGNQAADLAFPNSPLAADLTSEALVRLGEIVEGAQRDLDAALAQLDRHNVVLDATPEADGPATTDRCASGDPC